VTLSPGLGGIHGAMVVFAMGDCHLWQCYKHYYQPHQESPYPVWLHRVTPQGHPFGFPFAFGSGLWLTQCRPLNRPQAILKLDLSIAWVT